LGVPPAIVRGARAWTAGMEREHGARASCPQLLAGETCECKPLLGVHCGLGCSGSALPTIATGTVALLLGAHHRILSCMFHLRTIAGGTPALPPRRPSPYFKLHVSPAHNCGRDARAPCPRSMPALPPLPPLPSRVERLYATFPADRRLGE
jgi:hypothetical protein